ncbi:alpha/beta hydrolase [Mesobacillus foraminis]|uniref:alpha/beta hydrolase n=1 Tax=Mesobacillus foraminis TaxID=279826 RepID=UPI0039A1419A
MTYLLWPQHANGTRQEFPPTLTPYLAERNDKHSAIIVCPGGGYHRKAQHEGEPVALWLNSLGISAFVLDYRVSPNRHPAPLSDCQRAIRFVKHHSEQWNIDKYKVGILGFSAGGHLAASASTLHRLRFYEASDLIDQESARPDLAILCYPVISLMDHFHEGSLHNLLGEYPPDQLRAALSNEKNVTDSTPPTFLWHTADDASVPVENSLMYAQALSKKKIPFEMHIFPNGRHGLGLAKEDPAVSKWTDLCETWQASQGFGE